MNGSSMTVVQSAFMCSCSCMMCAILIFMEGFEKKEKSYRKLPEALLHWKVALELVSVLQLLDLVMVKY